MKYLNLGIKLRTKVIKLRIIGELLVHPCDQTSHGHVDVTNAMRFAVHVSHHDWETLTPIPPTKMVKKKVPDWLNSSLWSSSSPSSPPSSAVASPFEQPPPPPPRPPSPAVVTPSEPPPRPPSPPAVHDPLPTQRIDDSPREDHGDGFRSAHDVSRQAQLLAEVTSLCLRLLL